MQFTHYDLRSLCGGEVVEVTLSGNAANVKLMDSSNFRKYRSGRQHIYYGGHAKRSPVRIQVPRGGHWHVTVDLGGYDGSVKSNISILPGSLPQLKEAPLSLVPSLVRNPAPVHHLEEESSRMYDVFISHASEDKDSVARPLAIALIEAGLNVWFDEFELKIGDGLRRKIDIGLAKSRFGVIILSHSFLKNGWTNYELDGLVAKEVNGEQILLPIWHNISKDEVMSYSQSLANKLARNTATHTIKEIADEIAMVLR